jgi:DNA-binding transcriptional regulator YiaG
MPDLNKPIREEITRLTRKELKQALAAQKAINTALKKSLTAVKAECAELRRDVKAIEKRLPKPVEPKKPEVSEDKLKGFNPSTKMVKALRAKLGLSQVDFARLVGVSPQAVYLWERKDGALKLRSQAKAALFAIRSLGKREAKAQLAEMSQD